MSLTRIPSHYEAAITRLASQFKTKPRIQALVEDFIRPLDLLEDEIFRVLNFRWIDTATGQQLDGLGRIVGETRKGRNDQRYRLALRIRIAINVSKGTPEEVISIFSLVTGATDVRMYEYFPGVVEIYGNENFEYEYEFYGPDSFAFDGGVDGLGFGDVFDPTIGGVFVRLVLHDVAGLYRLMDSVLAAGVRLDRMGWFEASSFSFDGDPLGLGFGDVFDATIGGGFARIVL
jgi:hypothetical protein